MGYTRWAAAGLLLPLVLLAGVGAQDAAPADSTDEAATDAPAPADPEATPEPETRMVKIEKRRVAQRPEGARRSQEGLPPAQQIALFKEDARARMQGRLTELLDGTRRAQDARKRAKDLLAKAFEHQPAK